MANEKRLINANAFREFLEVIRMDYREEDTLSSGFAACLIKTVQDEYLALAPTVDAVEVVRCKDCKHYEEVCGEYTCFHPKTEGGWNSEGGESLRMNPMDFCSYGERKADD